MQRQRRRTIPKSNFLSWKYFENLPRINKKQDRRKEKTEKVYRIKSEVDEILNLFEIKHYFPSKLSLQKVLSIDDKSQFEIKKVPDIPWAILHKIISVDFHFRESILDEFIRLVQKTSLIDDEDDLFHTSTQSLENQENETLLETLHPMDVFLVIFQCCDPFLKQTIVHKVFECQLAVPYVYPDFSINDFVLSLWPLRGVFLDSKSECVATEPLKTIAFVRIGKGLEKSKSKIINEMLRNNNEEHSTFFHRDCPLGMNTRKLSNQLIEASWFVPRQWGKKAKIDKEKDETHIKDRLTVLNLRGDASTCHNQVSNLLMISNIVIIFISYNDLKKLTYINTLQTLHDSDCHTLLLTDQCTFDRSDNEFIDEYKMKINQSKSKMISSFMKKKRRYMNANELNLALKKNICTLLDETYGGINLEEISTPHIISDEGKTCAEMKAKVDLIYSNITKHENLIHRKEFFTPLQCEDLWQKCSQKEKQHCRSKLLSYDSSEPFLQDIGKLRLDQVRVCNEAPYMFSRFVLNLLDLLDDTSALQYFLYWMRYNLDKDSRVIIPNLLEDFSLAFQKYESAERKSDNQKQELDRIELELAKSSFGLEHFFREIGQVYEAFVYCKENLNCIIPENTDCVIKQLPEVVAKLLLIGQPLELMDGDAAYVPLVWIKAVFRELQNFLENKKLCSISVLGIQSSGKSTLLNTMFGLNFAVSAGRCTRGIFAQLVPVEKDKTNLKFDYALILDTEGLRAPEHAKENLNHDNELATFVIGLADIVVVNIKGETMSDIEDILQIVVHGLLRIKQAQRNIYLQQRSIFVHQNVAAEDAQSQMIQGNKKTVESLDKMTKEVALQEGYSSVACFRDVIKFDPTKDIRFLPDLWYGTRPMAPVSHHYSKKALNVRDTILKYSLTDYHSFLTFENKMCQMESLWKGILADDFVFSFRNCLEIKAYNLLEIQFQSLISDLDISKLKWMTDNIKPDLYRCLSPTQTDEKAGKLKNAFRGKIQQEVLEAELCLKEFIETSDLNKIMIQWRERKIIALREMIGAAIQEVDTKVQHEHNQLAMLRKTNNILAIKEEQINSKAKQIALSFKGKHLSTDIIKNKFDSIWDSWVIELVPKTEFETVGEKSRIMIEDLQNILFDKFGEQVPLMRKKLDEQALHSPVSDKRLENSIEKIKKSNLHSKSFFSLPNIQKVLNMHDTIPILTAVNAIMAEIDTKFDLLFTTETEYDKSHFRQIIDTIRNSFRKYNGNENNEYTLTPKFEIYVALRVSRYCCMKYEELIGIYEQEHGLRNKIQSSKSQKQQFFIDLCQAKSQEIIFTNLMSSTLRGLIKERILRELPIKIQREMINKYFKQKRSMMKSILEELAEKEDLKSHLCYIVNPGTYALRWITRKTDQLIFKTKVSEGQTMYCIWIENDLDNFIDDIKNAMTFATKERKVSIGSGIDVKNWMQTFADQLGQRHFLLDTYTFQQVQHFTVSSLSEVTENIAKELSGSVRIELLRDLMTMNQNNIKWSGKTPYEYIFDILWGCREHCPFCYEPCQKSQKSHASLNDCHTCIQHRPQGIRGIFRTQSRKLCIDTCNFSVQSKNIKNCGPWCSCPTPDSCENSHPFIEYKRFLPEWDIQPSPDVSLSIYWNWFLCSYQNELAKYYNKELPDIPPSYKYITKAKAIKSLTDVYES